VWPVISDILTNAPSHTSSPPSLRPRPDASSASRQMPWHVFKGIP